MMINQFVIQIDKYMYDIKYHSMYITCVVFDCNKR